jgi:hypothetical protein
MKSCILASANSSAVLLASFFWLSSLDSCLLLRSFVHCPLHRIYVCKSSIRICYHPLSKFWGRGAPQSVIPNCVFCSLYRILYWELSNPLTRFLYDRPCHSLCHTVLLHRGYIVERRKRCNLTSISRVYRRETRQTKRLRYVDRTRG